MQKFQQNFTWGGTGDNIINGKIDVNSRNSANASLDTFLGFNTDDHNSPLESYKNGTHNQVRSFLRITTSRTEYPGGKWHGYLNWYWSFKYKNKGFVTFNTAKTSDKEKKLVLTGGFYLVERNSESDQWKIKHKREVDDSKNKTIDKSNFDEYFPQPYWYTRRGGFDKYYWTNWKFMKGVGDLDNICTNTSETNKCPKKSIGSNSQPFAWEWSGGRWYDNNCGTWTAMGWCDYVWAWSSNKKQDMTQAKWWDYMYGDGQLGFVYRLQHFKGYWRELSIPRGK